MDSSPFVPHKTRTMLLTSSLLLLVACGGGGGGGSGGGGAAPPSYTVGGAVTGLDGGTLTLQNSGGNSLTINNAAEFTFSTAVSQGSAYNVTVSTQPAGKTCTVSYGSGTMGNAAISNVAVTCTPTPSAVDINGTNTLSSTHKPTLVGVVIDSPVSNLRYDGPGSLDGTTSITGEFSYQPGELITFKVGDVELPAVTGRPVITLFNFAGSYDLSNNVLINIARFLQSLDSDGNPDNGITITESAHTAATGQSLDFASASFDADANPIIAAAGGANTSLIDGATATAHFQSALDNLPKQVAIAGAWITGTGTDTRAVILLENGMYYGVEANCNGQPGYEYGSFAHNGNTLVLAVSQDANSSCGLNTGAHAVTVTDSTLTLDGASWSDVSYSTDNLSGLYADGGDLGNLIENEAGLLLFNATQYVVLGFCDDENPNNPVGLEFGTYTWNSGTLAFTYNTVADRYASCGPSGATTPITINNNGGFLVHNDSAGTSVSAAVRPARIETSLPGYWSLTGAGDNRAFYFPWIFTTGGTYINLENGPNCPSPTSSGEIGTFAWDAETGAFTYTITSDSSGECGDANLASGTGAEPDGDIQLLVTGNLATAYDATGSSALINPSRATLNTDQNGAVGIWLQTAGSGALTLLITQPVTTTLTIRALDSDCPRGTTGYTVESLNATLSAPNSIVHASASTNVDVASCGLPTTLGPTYSVVGDTLTIDGIGSFIRD